MTLALVTPLRRIPAANGDILHAMKINDRGFSGFGEAYFSMINSGTVKGWKRHSSMTLNIVVPCGEICFVIFRQETRERQVVRLTPDRSENYNRLTVPPGLWMAFGGVSTGLNLLVNIADLPHDPQEADTQSLTAFPWTWGLE